MMRFTTTFIVCLVSIASLVCNAQTNSASWVQRANQGPETPKTAKSVNYTLDATRLRVVLMVDSTGEDNYIYMVLYIPKYKGVGTYNVGKGALTYYQYGNRSDQKTTCDYGEVTVTAVDSVTNVVSADFYWGGTASLQNGITLTQKITQGKFQVAIKPELFMVPKPGEGAKFKRDKDETIKVYARDKYDLNRFFPGVTVTFTHDGTAFDGDKKLTQTTDANGAATFNLHVKENAVGGDYTYKVKGEKQNFIESEETTVKFKVEPTDRYYYTKCAGVSFVEFDAGKDNVWEDAGGTSIMSSSADIRLAGLIKVNGAISIDTSGGAARVSGQGDVYFDGVMFDGLVQPFYLYRGPITFFIPACEAGLDFLTSNIASELTGGKLKSAKLRFLGDGIASNGAEITCGMELSENAKEGCNDEVPFGTVWAPNKKSELELKLGFISNDTQTNFTASGTVKNFTPVASWCVKEATVAYDGAKSEISISGKVKSKLFEEIGGGVTFKDGTLNALNVDFSLANCIPVPETPLCWKGGGFKVENLQIGNPLKGSVNVKFGPLASQLTNLFELNIEGGFEDPPAKIYGKVTGNLLKLEAVSSEKPWQAELSGTGTAEFGDANKMTLDLEEKLLHLGGEYFYNGKASFSLAFSPDLTYTQSFDGSLTFQKLSDANVAKLGFFGKFLNGYAPMLLGKASGSMTASEGGPNTITFSYDMSGLVAPNQENAEVYAALKDLSHGTMTIDFDALPNPSAIELDGGFKDLLSGWFSHTEKHGGVVQAADVSFTVAEGQEAFAAFIESGASGLVSSLTDPDGTQLTQSNAADGVHYLHSADGKMTMWVIKAPKAGIWKLSAPNAAATDTFSIRATIPVPELNVTAAIQGTNLVLSWTGNDLPQNGRLAFFLTKKPTDNAGALVGYATVKDNTATFPMTDSTAPCSFSVMTLLTDPTAALTVHSDGVLSNPSMTLTPPQNVQAVSDQNGNTTITWSPVTDGRVSAITINDAATDTLLAAAYNFETEAKVTLTNTAGRQLIVRCVDKSGRSSCPTEALAITTDVNDEGVGTQISMNGIVSVVRPHPVVGTATVELSGLDASPALLQVVDVTGSVVMEQVLSGIVDGNTSLTLGTQNLSSGMYLLSVRQGSRVLTQGLVVTR